MYSDDPIRASYRGRAGEIPQESSEGTMDVRLFPALGPPEGEFPARAREPDFLVRSPGSMIPGTRIWTFPFALAFLFLAPAGAGSAEQPLVCGSPESPESAFRFASRCTCIATPGLDEARLSADAIFLGGVLSVDQFDSSGSDSFYGGIPERLIRFQVLGSWKGEPPAVVEVRTGVGDGDCGFPFQEGQHYLVFANGQGDALTTGICSRTAGVDDAVDDLRSLGVPAPPFLSPAIGQSF